MKSKFLLYSIIVIILALPLTGSAIGFEFLEPWGYVWVNGANHQTNLERDDFNSPITRAEAKIGLDLVPLWAEARIQPYGAYYGVSSDDKHSWNNNNIAGVGVQIMPLLGFGQFDWLQDLKIFYETLRIDFNSHDKDDGDTTEYHNEEDERLGLEIWHTWNQPGQYTVENRKFLWGELWGHLSYRRTNFEVDPFDTYMFYLQPKVGVYLGKLFDSVSFEPYFKVDATISGKDASYQNFVLYGVGLRIRPFLGGYLGGMDFRILRKFKLFLEINSASYLKDSGPVDNDFRIGFDFNIGR